MPLGEGRRLLGAATKTGELEGITRTLISTVEVFAADCRLRGREESAAILENELRRARAALANITKAGGG